LGSSQPSSRWRRQGTSINCDAFKFQNVRTALATAYSWNIGKRGNSMRRQTPRQRRIMGRVMHEFEHGELKSGASGKGGKGQEPPPGNSHVAQASASPRRVFLGTLFNVDFTSSRVSFSDTSARATRSIWFLHGAGRWASVLSRLRQTVSRSRALSSRRTLVVATNDTLLRGCALAPLPPLLHGRRRSFRPRMINDNWS
jgi:hypothetical protein